MTLAIDDGTRLNMRRPWVALAREMEEREGHWSDYAAWRVWLEASLDAMGTGPGFSPGPVLDMLDGHETEIGLYCLMCDLADGTAKAIPSPRTTTQGGGQRWAIWS